MVNSALKKNEYNQIAIMAGKRLYIAFSIFEYIGYLFFRFISLVAIMFSVPHYDENPIAVSIAVLFFSVVILFLGDDQIIVYEDRVSQNTHSIYTFLFRKKGTVIYIRDLSVIWIEEKESIDIKEVGITALIVMLVPRNAIHKRRNQKKPIEFYLKNGETITLYSGLPYDQLKKIVSIVNSLIT